jgi:DNA invertase Pin-like site-specific DNA recombinase
VPPVDVYVRVSRVGGRENMISPDEQERRGRELAGQHGLTVGEIIIDLDESGGKWERPGLQRALRRVETGESAGVIVAWLDRLSRDSEHAHALVRRITDAGGRIYAPDAPADWTSPEGELQAGILFEFAAYVRKRARAGFERAKQRAVEQGIPVHTRPPVGYRRGDDRRLEPDPDTAHAVRAVFEARVGGAGPTELAELLEQAGVRTSQGSRAWSKQAVYGLLRNRVYLGEVAYGRDRRFVNPAAHEPIVDVATFQLAQGGTGRHTGRKHLLSGLLRCWSCRYALQATQDSHGRLVYRCTRRHAGGICPQPARVRADRVELVVVADMRAHLPTIDAVGRRDESGEVATLSQGVEEARTALGQWASPSVQAEIGDLDIYVAGLRERRQRVQVAEAQLAALQQARHAAASLPHVINWEQAWEAMNPSDRGGLLATMYDTIVLRRNPDLLVIFPAGVGPVDLPRRGYSRDVALRGFADSDVPDGARVLAF